MCVHNLYLIGCDLYGLLVIEVKKWDIPGCKSGIGCYSRYINAQYNLGAKGTVRLLLFTCSGSDRGVNGACWGPREYFFLIHGKNKDHTTCLCVVFILSLSRLWGPNSALSRFDLTLIWDKVTEYVTRSPSFFGRKWALFAERGNTTLIPGTDLSLFPFKVFRCSFI